MPLQLLKYDPGIVKDITEYAAGKNGPYWVDGNLVRFRNGYPTKIGGWQNDGMLGLDPSGTITSTYVTLEGIARKTVFWRANSTGEDYMGIGTHNHLFILENGSLYDITPLRDVSNTATTTTQTLPNNNTSPITITVASVTGLTTTGAVLIGSEIITYTGISSLTLTGCTRATNGSSFSSHADGAAVTQALINPLAVTDGSAVVTITDEAHGGLTGDWVAISGAAAIGGITADAINDYYGYQITVLTPNTYTITMLTDATSTVAAGGGNAVTIKYLIGLEAGLGAQSSDPALGWGVGGWGQEAWGNPRSIANADVALDNSSWNLNLWGEDLIATIRGGAIYYWDTSAGIGTRAVLASSIAGADSVPNVVRVTTVSFPDRHFIAGGCQAYAADGQGDVDDMLIRWSTQEDFTKFAPTSLNTAGDQRLQVGTKIVTMVSAREETIISTDEAIYGMTFVGAPFIFSFRLLATDAGAAGLNTMISIDGNVFWMGKRNFFSYDGIVKELPCPVKYFVFDRMQQRYIDKVVVGHNKKFKEITWWYVSNDNPAGTVNPENDSYVTYNYLEGAWSIGSMSRTTWHDSFGVRDDPYAFDPSGYLYNHETGTSANGAAMNAYIETAPREITAEGENLYMVDRIVPNVDMSLSTSMDLYLNTRKYPSAPETTKGPFAMTKSTQNVSVRAKGRQISVKFQTTGTQDDWSLGDFRINTRLDGLR
tara:strand:+ start:206 stop:2338 length:2133 start_codon:yes stop_codon:yes gene_type:complete